MSNIHVIPDGRLVEDPRTFETKDKKTLVSIRVADNPVGGKDSKYKPMFVSFVLNEQLGKIVLERGLAKGDVVSVSGDLRIREYEKKGGGKGKKKKAKDGDVGLSYEIPFVNSFRIQSCKADNEPEQEEPDDEETEDEDETEEGEVNDSPFGDD